MRRFANANGPLRYLIQNSTKSVCQPSDSSISSFLKFVAFGLFNANFGDSLVTAERFGPSRTWASQAQAQLLQSKSFAHRVKSTVTNISRADFLHSN
jgi:hypothetical protein